MTNGTVKFFNAAKGFGFITSDNEGKDIFVPTASLTSSGISSLKPGQRVSFEDVPDTKGPKAVDIKLLDDLATPRMEKERPRPSSRTEARSHVTFYHDHTNDWSCDALAKIRATGCELVVVEYLITPPSKDELKALSRLLSGNGQSLVRKFDPLFLELRLDDRFISDSEFWEAIFENPVLIDGPLIATNTKASLCHSEEEFNSYFVQPRHMATNQA
jgi:cold shock CspA family protein/arsenate reductase-like glutaredoxin family protein